MPRAADSLINSRLCGAGGWPGRAGHTLAPAPTRTRPPGQCVPVCLSVLTTGAPVLERGSRTHLGMERGGGGGGARAPCTRVSSGCVWLCVCVSVVVICVCLPVCAPRLHSGYLCNTLRLCGCVCCSPSHPLRQSPLCPSPYSWGSRFLPLACPSWGPGRGGCGLIPCTEGPGRGRLCDWRSNPVTSF